MPVGQRAWQRLMQVIQVAGKQEFNQAGAATQPEGPAPIPSRLSVVTARGENPRQRRPFCLQPASDAVIGRTPMHGAGSACRLSLSSAIRVWGPEEHRCPL